MNSGILSAGFQKNHYFPTVPSMPVSPSSGSSPSTCFINHGSNTTSYQEIRFLSSLCPPKRKSILLSPPCRIQNPKRWLHSCILPASGSAKSVISRYCDIERKTSDPCCALQSRSDRYAILSQKVLIFLTRYWFACGRRPAAGFSRKQTISSVHRYLLRYKTSACP